MTHPYARANTVPLTGGQVVETTSAESVTLFEAPFSGIYWSGLLGVVGPVDPCFGWKLGWLRWFEDEAFRVGGVGGTEHTGPLLGDDFGGAVVNVGGRVKCQPGVAMLIVVPREEVLAVGTRRLDRGEPAGEVGPVLQRLELRLAERVVVRDVRP